MEAEHSGNPYDFRSPILSSGLLAGRENELAEIDEFLREATSGRRVHFSLFGGEGTGKSSLLNGVVDLARERGFLAVKLTLRDAIVESDLAFYKAVFDAALQGLLELGRLGEEEPLMRNWLLQTCSGDHPDASAAEPGLELGLLLAAKLNGRMVPAVPSPLLKRDLVRLLSIGGEQLLGVVLCVDNAELLDRNHDLAPSILDLSESTGKLTLVTAAEGAGSLQQAAPRAWGQIEVEAFGDPGDVLDAITKPLNYLDESLDAPPPRLDTAIDVLELTGGVPYEVNLVCHFIWDAIKQGEQDTFELSPAVIERVTRELEEKGRHQASEEIARFGALSTIDYDLLLELAPYEALTTRQLALLRLMLNDYEESDLEASEAQVGAELELLAQKGAIHLEQGRFEILGGRDARLYLRYLVQRQSGRKLRYGNTYPRAATRRAAAHLGEALVGDGYEDARIFRRSRPREVGGSDSGAWIQAVTSAVADKDLVTLAELLGPFVNPQDLLESSDRALILIGLQLQASLHDVEHAEILTGQAGQAIEEVREAAERWAAENEALLSKYDISVAECRCEVVPAELLCAAIAYFQLRVICQASYVVYRAGAAEVAEGFLGAVLDTATVLVGADPTDPLLRTQFASAFHRRGFMAATRGDWATALERLEHSRAVAVADEWLLKFNLAYVHANQGDHTKAAGSAASALERYEPDYDQVLLHGYFPTLADWDPPFQRWNVVELQGKWIARFVELQVLLHRCFAEPALKSDLEAAFHELSTSAPPPLFRLAGWCWLSLFDRPDLATEAFAQALGGTRYDQAEIARLELEYAQGRSQPSPAAAPS